MDTLSAADVMALTNNNENGWQNNPFIYLVWLAVLGGGGGLFGNRNADAATQGAITRADLHEGLQTHKFKTVLEDFRMDYAMASMLTTQQLSRDLQE